LNSFLKLIARLQWNGPVNEFGAQLFFGESWWSQLHHL
jgi:hypothetical protein